MEKRLGAFVDTVIAIVVTLLVLELEKPENLNLHSLWLLRESFFAYAYHFFGWVLCGLIYIVFVISSKELAKR